MSVNEILDLVAELNPDEKRTLLNELQTLVDKDAVSASAPSTEETWTQAELDALFRTPSEALTMAEIVQKHVESGVIGSWADMGIEDGAQWVNEQKQRRAGKYKW
ncbi:MAG: hypothetical protein AAF125_06670 [Chloroflexota bacterium]